MSRSDKKPLGRPRSGETREKLQVISFKADEATRKALALVIRYESTFNFNDGSEDAKSEGRKSQVLRKIILEACEQRVGKNWKRS